MNGRKAKIIFLALLFVVLLFMPKLVSEYRLNMVITMLIYALFALSYNILFGQAGLLSFGHAAYFGVGAYTAVLMIKLGKFSILPALAGGAVAGAILGLLLGFFVVRLGGTYFALLTLAFNALVYAGAEKWRSVTGGEDGVAAMRPDLTIPGVGSVEVFSTVNWYYLVMVVVVISTAYCWYFTKTPMGRLNLALRENEERCRFVGYNTFAARIVVNIVSAFFAGLAGALAGTFQEFVTVTFINLDKATEVLIMTFVGGGGHFWGPIFGACFLTILNDTLSSLTEHWALIQGAIFVLLVMYAPMGLSDLIVRAWNFLRIRMGFAGKAQLE